VVRIVEAQVVEIDRKIKVPGGIVEFFGARDEACAFLQKYSPPGKIAVGSTLTGGDGSTLTGGDRSTLTGGDRSTLTGGDRSTLTGGDRSTLTGGDRSTLTGGDGSTLTGGDGSTLTGGDRSTLTGGDGSTLSIRYSNGKKYRIAVFEVGENGIEPNQPYRADNTGKPVKVVEAVRQ
jgi:hypothetical protein